MTDTTREFQGSSLVAGAAYCAGIGAGTMAMRGPIGKTVQLPPSTVMGAGLASVAWGLSVGFLSLRSAAGRPGNRTVGGVAAGNMLGAAGLAFLAAGRPTRAGRMLTAIVAGQLALVALGQAAGLVMNDRKR